MSKPYNQAVCDMHRLQTGAILLHDFILGSLESSGICKQAGCDVARRRTAILLLHDSRDMTPCIVSARTTGNLSNGYSSIYRGGKLSFPFMLAVPNSIYTCKSLVSTSKTFYNCRSTTIVNTFVTVVSATPQCVTLL